MTLPPEPHTAATRQENRTLTTPRPLLSALAGTALALVLGAAATAQQPQQPTPAAPIAAVPNAPALSANSYVLMDFASGQVLAAKNPDARVEPASLTKMMASYLVFNELAAGRVQPTDQVTISEKAWKTGGSKMFVEVGKQVAVEDLLMGMVVQSGNDATVALAEHLGGTEAVFAQMMNAEAARLGMTGTHFVNADGLPDPEHYTTAMDMALLSRALIQDHPEHYATYKVKEFTWNGITQHNRNALLWRDASIDGIKTGHTEAAGYCLAASAEREGMRLVAVVMGTDSEKTRADEAQALLNYGFRFFESHTLYQPGREVAQAKVWKGSAPTVALGLERPVVVAIGRGRYDALEASMDVPTQLLAPVAKGQPIGTLRVSLGGEVLAEQPLVALAAVEEGGFFKRMNDSFWMWWESD
jgi:D-alanyl-D-alanine carboxypeptidase (penicillin-binding protein 5/6)